MDLMSNYGDAISEIVCAKTGGFNVIATDANGQFVTTVGQVTKRRNIAGSPEGCPLVSKVEEKRTVADFAVCSFCTFSLIESNDGTIEI